MKTGVARKPIKDLNRYKLNYQLGLDPTASFLQKVFNIISPLKKRIVFAEGEEDMVIRNCIFFQKFWLWTSNSHRKRRYNKR